MPHLLPRRSLLALSPLCFLLACGDGATPAAGGDNGGTGSENANGANNAGMNGELPAAECVPTRASYDSVRPLFQTYCSTCHGEQPAFGAPFSLLDYDSVLGRHRDGYIVDYIAHALSDRIMPPAEQPQPDDVARAAMIDFATCGQNTGSNGEPDGGSVDHDGGHGNTGGGELTATRDPLVASDTPPVGATEVNATANEFVLASTAKDLYQTFQFPDLVSEDKFIRRFEPVIDDARVVHHLTLRFTGNRNGYLYTWAPGGPAIDFPDGGIRLTAEDTLLLEVHYNNGVGATDVKDSSGVKLWLSTPGGTEYGLANLATWEILVPAGQTTSAKATCNVENAVKVFAAAPHMHETGDSFEHIIDRATGPDEDLVSLTGWSFTAQRYYSVNVDLVPGDVLRMKCTFVNKTSRTVRAGTGTKDEMCFDFMYVTPPNALANCNDNVSL